MKPFLEFILPIAWCLARWHERKILRHGSPLSPPQLEMARNIGLTHPENVRIFCAPRVPPVSRLLLRLGRALGFLTSETLGMTLRYGVYVRADCVGNPRLLAHELAHVMQYERLGGMAKFLRAYLSECFEHGYPFGPLEQEAKCAERHARGG